MKTILRFLFLLALISSAPSVVAQSSADSTAIRKVALDFIEGWYTADDARFESSVHPEMISKVVSKRGGQSRLERFTVQRLVELTRRGGGKNVPLSERRKEIAILDIYQNAASVKVLAYDAMEYLHVAKWNGEWKIINILFERKK